MSVLHTYFHRRDQQAFQRAIDAAARSSSGSSGPPSSSVGRSLSASPLAPAPGASAVDINARDGAGRTVLHLACSSTHASAPMYVRLALAHPHVQVNLQDAESHWTALHRAMYHGNIACALLLLQRPDVDVHAKDWEGYTAYDVWNSSIEGTKPDAPRRRDAELEEEEEIDAELYVWGSNRNAALGVGDGDDRAFPELVQFDRDKEGRTGRTLEERFRAVRVRGVGMARFHTAMVTSDPRTNLRVCGFGSGARLGTGIYTTTYTPTPLAGLPSSSTSPLPGYSSPSRPPTTSRSSQSSSLRSREPGSPGSLDPQRIVSVTAGQDHTLALTAAGEVWSWGSNRHAVLGYAVEPADEPCEPAPDKKGADKSEAGLLQPAPRKVQGQLKGRRARGVSACRTASACVTEDGEVLTWGVNSGQLGYDRVAHPVQILPRVVTKVSQPVLEVTITDTSTALLLSTHDVLLLTANSSHKLSFPSLGFPNTIAAYRPPQATRNAAIDKVVATELSASNSAQGRESAMFAALSRNGELFTWVIGASDTGAGAAAKEKERERERRDAIRPQRVWALRKKFSAVRDVALGADGSILVCTESGHVFLRSRTPNSTPNLAAPAEEQGGAGKAFKFQRVPFLQRVVRVCANSTGAFAALRVDARVEAVRIEGLALHREVERVVPWFGPAAGAKVAEAVQATVPGVDTLEDDPFGGERLRDPEDDAHDPATTRDQAELTALLGLLDRHAQAVKASKAPLPADGSAPLRSPLEGGSARAHGADMLVHILGGSEPHIPAHRVILAARSRMLREVLSGKKGLEAKVAGGAPIRLALAKEQDKIAQSSGRTPNPWNSPARLTASGSHPLTMLILLRYLYTDELIAIWDSRVAGAGTLKGAFERLKVRPAQVKAELQALAGALELREMEQALEGAFKREVRQTLARDLGNAEAEVCEGLTAVSAKDPLRPDVVLLLADREVPAHSVVLRARSPFFRAFFDEEVWTVNRWTAEGTLRVDLRHMRWREVQYVAKYLYGADAEMFDALEDVANVDELVEAVFGVMSAANELLLDRLVLLCSRVIQQRISIPNTTNILADATFFNATALVRSVQGYMARNLETLLERRMLDELSADLVKQFSQFVRAEQTRKAPVARSGRIAEDAMARNRAWVDTQDWPSSIVRSTQPRPPAIRNRNEILSLPVRPVEKRKSAMDMDDGELFMMDGVDAIPPLSLSAPAQAPQKQQHVVSPLYEPKPGGWKVPSAAPKVDMKVIMAEAATSVPRPSVPRQPAASDAVNWRTPQRKSSSTALSEGIAPRTTLGGSPWKLVPSVPSMANLAAGGSPIPTPPMTPQMRATRAKDEVPAMAGKPQTTPQRPGMGPVFSPNKQAPQKGTTSPMRRTASITAAWTLPPVQPVQPSPSLTSTSATPTSAMSFVAIQELQREQDGKGKEKKRSLKEIQEEEQARHVEEEFLAWWTAEEERLRLEQTGEMPTAAASPRRAKGKKKEGVKDGANGVKEGGKKKVPGDNTKEKKDGGRREGASKDATIAAEGSAPGTPRRRRRPGPGPNAKAESSQATTDVSHQQQ